MRKISLDIASESAWVYFSESKFERVYVFVSIPNLYHSEIQMFQNRYSLYKFYERIVYKLYLLLFYSKRVHPYTAATHQTSKQIYF